MRNLEEILRELVFDKHITIEEFKNAKLYVVFRIVWKTKYFGIIHVFPTEKEAIDTVKGYEEYCKGEYFYREIVPSQSQSM